MPKQPSIGSDARTHVAKFIPNAISIAFKSYNSFLRCGFINEADPFKGRHDAARAALSHIHMLLRIAGMANLPDEDINDFKSILADAMSELKKHKDLNSLAQAETKLTEGTGEENDQQ